MTGTVPDGESEESGAHHCSSRRCWAGAGRAAGCRAAPARYPQSPLGAPAPPSATAETLQRAQQLPSDTSYSDTPNESHTHTHSLSLTRTHTHMPSRTPSLFHAISDIHILTLVMLQTVWLTLMQTPFCMHLSLALLHTRDYSSVRTQTITHIHQQTDRCTL